MREGERGGGRERGGGGGERRGEREDRDREGEGERWREMERGRDGEREREHGEVGGYKTLMVKSGIKKESKVAVRACMLACVNQKFDFLNQPLPLNQHLKLIFS